MFAAGKTSGASAAAPTIDAQFNYVTMLLHGDGTNGAQNNTFLDSSTNNFTITRNGNTTQGSFSPYGSNWSNYFDGTGDYLSTPNVAALQPGTSTNPFCIECWIYPLSTPVSDTAILGNLTVISYPTNCNGFDLLHISTNEVAFRWGRPNYNDSGVSPVLSLNTWNHVAMCRNSSGSMSCYLNGTRWYNASINTSITNATASSFWVGWAGSVSGSTINPFNGYISNVRFVNGSTPYDPTSSTLTVPTAPLTAITNTSLLTCADNRFIDDSASPKTITPNGNTSVQRFNPFGASTAYSTSVIGGSGYFDGNGDYLTVPDASALDFGTGNFTWEAWVYATSLANSPFLMHKSTGNGSNTGWFLEIGPGNAYFGPGTSGGDFATFSSSAVSVNNWFHIAVTRVSTTVQCFINGTSIGTSTASNYGNNVDNSAAFGIGSWRVASNSFDLAGYISDLRVVKGTAVYTSNFTPPTAPLTAITNTSLLTNMTNGAIFDNAMMNDLETVGNAQISTSVVKYGTGSMYFDGTGDALYSTSQATTFGTGDFTLEFWIYFNAVNNSTVKFIYDMRNAGATSASFLAQEVGNNWTYWNGAATSISSGFTSSTFTASTWTHVAICRSSGTTRFFVNGTQTNSVADTSNYANSTLTLGARYSYSDALNGYIDDLRITKFARYTANFTPPTAAFPNTGPY